MKKWKDVSIRVKVMIPIVLMLAMMIIYLVGTLYGFGEMHRAVVSLAEENTALIIEVADMGPQIAEKERRRICERFYTVSKSRKNSGFGLSLSIVKHIAFMYGGSAKVYANDNNGNTFKITLYERK